jgi:hypothetical protein
VPNRARAFVADPWAGYTTNMVEFEFPTETGGGIPRSNRCDRTVQSLIPGSAIQTERFGQIEEEDTMFTRATLGLAVILATASGALAAMKSHVVAPSRDAYTAYNRDAAYIGTDPDRSIRFELNRDQAHRVGQ